MAVSNNLTNEKDGDMQKTDSLTGSLQDGFHLPERPPEETVIPLLTNISEINKFVGVWEKEKSK